MTHHRRNAPRIAALALIAATGLALSSPTHAHNSELGDGGPFEVVVTDTDLPGGLELRVGNGELEIHVPSGTTAQVLDEAGNPFVKVDAQGNMFGNTDSTFWNATDASERSAASTDGPWAWVQGGGSIQYDEPRLGYNSTPIPDSVADGGVLSKWSLEFTVDGSSAFASGELLFAPELDPQAASDLLAGESPSSLMPVALVVAAMGLTGALVGGTLGLRRTSKRTS